MKQVTAILFVTGCLCTFSISHAKNAVQNRLLKATGPTKASFPPLLFNINNQPDILFKKKKEVKRTKYFPKFLSKRVYLVFDEKNKKWIYVLTDFEGQLPEPLEAFRNLTVLPGKYLGAKNPKYRYQLTAQGIWVRTFQQQQQYLWVYGSPPKIKAVTFKPVNTKK